MEWWELDEGERIKQVYSKYTLQDFWEWWSDKQPQWMEIRIKDYNLIKLVKEKFNYPISTSGVYIYTPQQLKNIISFCRDKATIWFGMNPRKRNFTKFGYKGFGSGEKGGSSDLNVECISFLFVDIDRKVKIKSASKEELHQCDMLSNYILEKLGNQKWNNNYAKICSGNGVQLVIKLDIPIKLPQIIFNNLTKTFNMTEDFEKTRSMLKYGIGNQIIKFSNKITKEKNLNVDVDGSCFKLMGVGALPATKNYKYDGFTWRGLIHIQKGVNDGLSDYISNSKEDIKFFNSQNVFSTRKIYTEDVIKPGQLSKNKIVRFMLDYDLPHGMINNKIWFSLKLLLRDSNFDLNSEEFKKIHKELETKYKDSFTTNFPEKRFKFNEMVVNRFCVEYGFPLLYDLYSERSKELNMKLDKLTWDIVKLFDDITLNPETDIWQDMDWLKYQLKEGDDSNTTRVYIFTNGCIKKYGEQKTKYYFDTLFKRYLSFSN